MTTHAMRSALAAAVLLATTTATRPASADVRVVTPADDLARIVADAPAATTFLLAAGVYRAANIRPKDGQVFDGQRNATVSGAVLLSGFRAGGAVWRADGPAPAPLSHGACDARGRWAERVDGCLFREDLFVDGWPVRRVFSEDAVTGRSWFQNRTSGAIAIGFDPRGHAIEISHADVAFAGNARDVVIRNLTVERFASTAQRGAIQADQSRGWRIENDLIRQNSGAGIRLGRAMHVIGSRVLANGQIGITGSGDDIVIEDNEIAGNNAHGFSPAWEAGGTKFVDTDKLIVERNCVHHNDGPGLWTDIDNRNSLIADNVSAYNGGVGIFHEISGRALIARNLGVANGSIGDSPWSSQILVSGSIDTTVWRNRVVVAAGYGHGIFIVEENRPNESKRIHDGPTYAARDNVVAENTIMFLGSRGVYGLAGDQPNSPPLHERNRFVGNTVVSADARPRFTDRGTLHSLDAATALGQERDSRVIPPQSERDTAAFMPACVAAGSRLGPSSGSGAD